MGISKNTIESIRDRLSIEDVVGQYLPLTSKGRDKWAVCPFHGDKNPSMILHHDNGTFHCFGCNASGTIFDFVMKMDHLDFVGAVEKLAGMAGVEMKEENPQEKRKRSEREALCELYSKLSNSLRYILVNSKDSGAAKARQYLEARGISYEMQKAFCIGYAPNDWDWMRRFLNHNYYSDEILAKSGLFAKSGASYFVGRLMFPVWDSKGNIVAFSGRDITGRENAPKYINSSESAIYSKGKELFGFHQALDSLRNPETDNVFICEGNFDVVAMHQAGLSNTVASCGTAFTQEQASLLGRYCSSVTTLFDSDVAGENATLKTLVMLQRLGLKNYVCTLEDAKDAAEVLEKAGAQGLLTQCSLKRTGFEYLVQKALKMYDASKPEGKRQVAAYIKPYLDATSSEILRSGYLKILSERLGIDESSVRSDFSMKEKAAVERPVSAKDSHKDGSEGGLNVDLFLMEVLVRNRNLFSAVRRELKIEDLQEERAKKLYTLLCNAERNGSIDNDVLFAQSIEDSDFRDYVNYRLDDGYKGGMLLNNPQHSIDECLTRIGIRKKNRELQALQNLIRMASYDGSREIDSNKLLGDLVRLRQEKAELERKLNGERT